jgi:ABC-type branched-subunit amino acid transport system substrate-binding protein
MLGCAKVMVLPQDPAQAPLRERRLASAELERLKAQAALGGAEAARALYFLGLDDAAQGRWPEAGERWQSVVKRHAGSGWDRLAQYKTAEALEQVGDAPRAFVQYQALLSGTAVADLPERAQAACLRLIDSMPEDGLRRLAEGAWAQEAFVPLIQLRLLERGLAKGLTETVRSGLEAFLERFPTGPGLDRAERLSRSLEKAVPADPRALGLLVPQTGPLAPFGRQVRQGVELALRAANEGLSEERRFRLHVADEGGTTLSAQAAGRRLADQHQVVALLGPLGSDSAMALLPSLATRRLPMFSPSASRDDLAETSRWFFRNTLTPAKQAAALADHAFVARRLTRVAVLAPDSAYGQALSAAFAARIHELGGEVVRSLTYTPGTRDFKSSVLELGGIDPGEAKTAEAEERRDQQSRVEEASTGLGRFLLGAAKGLSDPAGTTVTPRLRLLVLGFSEDSASAELNAGRAFADRFSRTLGQLPELELMAPALAADWMQSRRLSPTALGLPDLVAMGNELGAHYILGGASLEIEPVKQRPGRRDRHFELLAQLVDPASGEVAASRRIHWTKYQPPDPNPLGLQALYLPSTAEDLSRLVPTLAFCELNVPLLGSDQWDRPELHRLLPEIEGAVFSAAYWPDNPDEAVQRFDAAYRTAFAARPGLLSAQAFDAASLVLDRLRSGYDTRDSLREALSRVHAWQGVTGRTSFSGRQDAIKRPALVRVHEGALQLIKEP